MPKRLDTRWYYSSAEACTVLGIAVGTLASKVLNGTLTPQWDAQGYYWFAVQEVQAYKRWRQRGHRGRPGPEGEQT